MRDSDARQSKTVLHFDDYLKMILLFRVCLWRQFEGRIGIGFYKRRRQPDKQTRVSCEEQNA